MPNRTALLAISAAVLSVWNGVAYADDGLRRTEAPVLLPLDPIAIPMVDHGELVGRLELRAMWRVTDEAALQDADRGRPQLRALLVDALGDHVRRSVYPERPVDPAALADHARGPASKAGFRGELVVLEAVARAD